MWTTWRPATANVANVDPKIEFLCPFQLTPKKECKSNDRRPSQRPQPGGGGIWGWGDTGERHTLLTLSSIYRHGAKLRESAPPLSPTAGSSTRRSDCPCRLWGRRRIAQTETKLQQPAAEGEKTKSAVSQCATGVWLGQRSDLLPQGAGLVDGEWCTAAWSTPPG